MELSRERFPKGRTLVRRAQKWFNKANFRGVWWPQRTPTMKVIRTKGKLRRIKREGKRVDRHQCSEKDPKLETHSIWTGKVLVGWNNKKQRMNLVGWQEIELRFARRCLNSCSRSMARNKLQIQRKMLQMQEDWGMIFQSQKRSLKQKSLKFNNKKSQIKQQNIRETRVQFKIWVFKVKVLKISVDLSESALICNLEGKAEFKDQLGSKIQMNLQRRSAQ